jgi:tRNA pseudouridine55 synthase
VARRKPSRVHGVVVVDKPPGLTSHDVVDVLRRRFDERRVGHAGTLDPPATGVLVCALGRATRLLRFVTDQDKTYTTEIVLGTTTTTLDDTGEVVERFDMSAVTPAHVAAAARGLTGQIEQVPPMVSAVKVDGRRLHELARQGVVVEREPRPVSVHEFAVEATSDPAVFRARVRCGSGTFVRSLAADLGSALGGGGYLRHLRRVAVGPFTAAEAASPAEAPLLGVEVAVQHLDKIAVDGPTAAAVAHGAMLDGDLAPAAPPPWAVFGPTGLLAVYERAGARIKPVVVLGDAAMHDESERGVR